MSKFKVGDKVVKADGEKWASGEKYKFITKINFWREEYSLSNGIGWWDEKELKLYEEVKEMKELTFKEVIANIKEGEVWESTKKTVSLINGAINIERKNKIETYYIYIKESELFKLQRKEYTFQEAFKAYKEGRIPESAINGQILDSHSRIDMRIIEGKWYIND